MPISKQLEKRLYDVHRTPVQIFCHNVRTVASGPRFAQPDACSIDHTQFLTLVVFFTYAHPGDMRADAALRRESADVLRRFNVQPLRWSETDKLADRMPWSNRWGDSRHLAGLLDIQDAIQYSIFATGRDAKAVMGLPVDEAREIIENNITKRDREYVPLNRAYDDERAETRSNLQMNLKFKPDRVKVENLILKHYMGLVYPHPGYKGVFLCDKLVELMGPSLRGWRLIRFLGGGAYGKVFQMQDPTGKIVAVKFMVENERGEAEKEVRAQRIFHGLALSPPVFAHETIKTHGGVKMHLIVMGRIDITLEERLCMAGTDVGKIRKIADDVVNLMARMRTAQVTHGDMHTQNVAYEARGGKYVPLLIDFGQSSTKANEPAVDAEQLIRVLLNDNYTYSYIIVHALRDYLDKFVTYQLTGDDRVQYNLWNKYMDKRAVYGNATRRRLLSGLADIVERNERAPRRGKPRKSKPRKSKPRRKRKPKLDLVRQLM